jgi:hypothetical protein
VVNILFEKLPTAVMIHSQEVKINTNFRDCLRVILAFEDNALSAIEKQMILIDNLYPDPPKDTQEAFIQGLKFLNGGQPGEEDNSSPRLYSFAKDANFILAAFQQTHGLDLPNTEYLHWWQFLALFSDLGANTTFCNLVALRKRVKTGKATKEERQAAREMGDLFEVPEIDNRSLEEKEQEAEFLRLVTEGERNRANQS